MGDSSVLYEKQLHEECGVFGVVNIENASELMYYGLHALQHRGQEGCGIITTDYNEIYCKKGEGLVTEIFNEEKLVNLKGDLGIGHVRYSTAGGSGIANVQPFLFRHYTGDFALCHNGNIVNSENVKRYLEKQGSIFQSTSDSEMLAHLVKKDKQENRIDAIKSALNLLDGGFAFLVMTRNKIYAVRDKLGLRPLSLGKLNGGYILSSETCALEIVGAKFVRDIKPGEILTIHNDGRMESSFYATDTSNRMCAMEYIYFSRPDSDIEGLNVHTSRKAAGKILAQESFVEGDVVIGVPDSSTSAASGFAEESKIPQEMGFIKNKYVGRTFIQPSQAMREKGVKMKLSPVRSIVEGQRVIVIDDSIVRGTTMRKIIQLLRDYGATEVHVRIASPAIMFPCFYGVDISTYEELISARLTEEQVCENIGADTLKFLSLKGLYKACNRSQLCTACFNGDYPTYVYKKIEEANKDGKF